VLPHPYFTRKDDDIHLDLPISLKEAVLGAKVKVPTTGGAVTVAGQNGRIPVELSG
jgi:DnaJ-class molecular chaperone